MVITVNFVYDVQQLLKKFGIFIYLGDRLSELELMEVEVKELYLSNLISKEEMHQALSILKNEINFEKTKGKGD